MVTRILELAADPEPADAADALALAICHLWRGPADLTAGLPGSQTAAQQAGARPPRSPAGPAAAGGCPPGPPAGRDRGVAAARSAARIAAATAPRRPASPARRSGRPGSTGYGAFVHLFVSAGAWAGPSGR